MTTEKKMIASDQPLVQVKDATDSSLFLELDDAQMRQATGGDSRGNLGGGGYGAK
jgi:hypothetical protein